jgi:AcrR family transcriptional regulator
MPRVAAVGRLDQIGDAALRAFSDAGFRRTQIADIAKLAGVAPGTIYLYASSKEALFWLALKRAMGEPLEDNAEEQKEVLDRIREKFAHLQRVSPLGRINEFDPGFEDVLNHLWTGISQMAPAIRLVEQCASEWPELANVFFGEARRNVLESLRSYFDRAVAAGDLRKVPDTDVAVRMIVETIAWFTLHRQGDFDGMGYQESLVKPTVLDGLFHAYSLRSTLEDFR